MKNLKQMLDDKNPILEIMIDFVDVHKNMNRKDTNTSRSYENVLFDFYLFLREQSITDIKAVDIKLINIYFKKMIISNDNFTKANENYRKVVLRSFFNFCHDNEIDTILPNKIKLQKQQEKDISKEILSKDDIDKILENIENNEKDSDIIKLRDKIILLLLFETCFRVSELCKINRHDIDFENRQITVVSKGNKITTSYFSKKTSDLLSEYFRRRDDNSDALIINHSNKGYKKDKFQDVLKERRITDRGVRTILLRRVKGLDINNKIYPHLLRHSGLTNFLRKGMDIVECQRIANHSSITTTRRYLKIADNNLRKKAQNIMDDQ